MSGHVTRAIKHGRQASRNMRGVHNASMETWHEHYRRSLCIVIMENAYSKPLDSRFFFFFFFY